MPIFASTLIFPFPLTSMTQVSPDCTATALLFCNYILLYIYPSSVKNLYLTPAARFLDMLIVVWWQPEPLCLVVTIASVIRAQPPDAHIATHLFGEESEEHLGMYSANPAQKRTQVCKIEVFLFLYQRPRGWLGVVGAV